MSSNFKRNITIVFIVVLICSVGVFFAFKNIINKPLKISSSEMVTIEVGESFYSFLEQMKVQDKIKNTAVIKIYTKIKEINLDIIPGSYILEKQMSITDIIHTLQTESDLNMVDFTVPEGFTVEDIGEKLQSEGICNFNDFITEIERYPLPSYVKDDNSKKYKLEGYLFPDTYKFKKGTEPKLIVKTLVLRFEEVLNKIAKELGVKIEDTEIEKIITIASIIEKEARVDEERSTISSVIYNRIDEEMLLQIDATVLYAHGYHKEKLYYSDLEIDSPYNTYLYNGLPVGPISNPGVPSIIAALKPEKTNFLFYVLEKDNTHYFTDDDEDFMKKQEELGY